MGTDDVFTRKDKKLGTGISDDFYMEHNGTDSKLVNSTGNTYIQTTTATKKTIINNGSGNNFVFDHDNLRFGINTGTPSHSIHIIDTIGQNIVAEYTGGSEMSISSGASYGFSGTLSNHNYRLITNNLMKLEIRTNGDVAIPAAYTTVIGGTNTDLYIDNTGLIGPLPSSQIYKINIRDLVDSDTNWIYNITVKKCDYIDGTMDQITVIAEEAAIIHENLVRYTPFFKNGMAEWELLDRSMYANLDKITDKIAVGEEKIIELEEISMDENGETSITIVEKEVRLQPITVNRSDLIYPLLKELQKLENRIEVLEGIIAGNISISKKDKK